MAVAGQKRRGGMGVFVAGSIPEGLLLRPQELRQPNGLRFILVKGADPVLPRHALGKLQADAARVNAQHRVEPPVFLPHLFKRPHPHPSFQVP